MVDKFKSPEQIPEEQVVDTKSQPSTGMTRRDVLRKTVKATYVVPVLTVLSITPISGAAYSDPPPPPSGRPTGEDMRKKSPNRR